MKRDRPCGHESRRFRPHVGHGQGSAAPLAPVLMPRAQKLRNLTPLTSLALRLHRS